jgi:hypothetical protein
MTNQPSPDAAASSASEGNGHEVDGRSSNHLAGAVYSSFIESQLAEERSSKSSLENRGITVITTSGSVVGVLFGLLAVIGGTTQFELPAEARSWFGVALVALTLSAIGGLLVNMPLAYEEADPEALKSLLFNPDGSWAPEWEESAIEGSKRVAQANIKLLGVARKKNRVKSRILFYSQITEVVGVGLLAIAIGFTL